MSYWRSTQAVQRQALESFGREFGSLITSIATYFPPPILQLSPHFSKDTYRSLAYLDLAQRAILDKEVPSMNLVKSTPDATGLDERGAALHTRSVASAGAFAILYLTGFNAH